MTKKSPLDRVIGAFSGPDDFRTIGGIAREAGMKPEDVRDIIARNSEFFEQAPMDIGGAPVYALREKVACLVCTPV